MSLRTLGGSILLGPGGPLDCDDNPCCTGGSGPPGPCNYVVSCADINAPAIGGPVSRPLSVEDACPWHIESSTSWIHLTPPTSHLSSGNIAFTVDANPSMCFARIPAGRIFIKKSSIGPGDPICGGLFGAGFIAVIQGPNPNAIAKMMRIIVERTARAGGAAPAIAWPTRIYQEDGTAWPVLQQALPTVPRSNFYSAGGVVQYPDDDFYKGDLIWRDADPLGIDTPPGPQLAGTFAAKLVNAVRSVMDTGSGVSPVGLYFADILGLDFRIYDNVTGLGTKSVYDGGSLPVLATSGTYCERYEEFLAALPKLLGAAAAISQTVDQNYKKSYTSTRITEADTKSCIISVYAAFGRSASRAIFTEADGCTAPNGYPNVAINSTGMVVAIFLAGSGFLVEVLSGATTFAFIDTNFFGVSNREMYGKIGFGGSVYQPPAMFGSPANGFWALISAGVSSFIITEAQQQSELGNMVAATEPAPNPNYEIGWNILVRYGVVYFTFTESF